MAETEENVAADTYFAIAETLNTEEGWSVLENVELLRELVWESAIAFGRMGANHDLSHPQRKLWERLLSAHKGEAPNGRFDH